MGIPILKHVIASTLIATLSFAVLSSKESYAGKNKSCRQLLNSESNKRRSFKKKKHTQKNQYSAKIKIPYNLYKKLHPKVLARLKKTKNKPQSIIKTLDFISRDFNKRGFLLSNYDILYLEQLIEKYFQSFSGNQISVIFMFYSRLKFAPSPSVYKKIMPRLEKQLHTLTERSLAEVYFSIAKLGIKPSERFSDKWFNLAKASKFNRDQLAISTYAFALLGLLEDKRVEPFFKSVKLKFKSIESSKQVSLGLIANYYRYVLKKPNHYLNQFDKPILVQAKQEMNQLEYRFSKILDSKNNVYEHEYITKLGTAVDFYLPNENIIYQVDGPTHFILNSKNLPLQQRPKDIFMDEIHEALGYKVYRKPFYEVEETYSKL